MEGKGKGKGGRWKIGGWGSLMGDLLLQVL